MDVGLCLAHLSQLSCGFILSDLLIACIEEQAVGSGCLSVGPDKSA